MKSLIIAEHNNEQLAPVTASVVNAASNISGEIVVLVAGKDCGAVAEQAAQLAPVTTVLLCDDDLYQHALAEPLANLVIANAEGSVISWRPRQHPVKTLCRALLPCSM